MPHPITRAQPPLEFIPPRFNPLVLQIGRSLLPFWLRWYKQIRKVDIHNADGLARLYEQFQAGEVRFLIAFRHPTTSDPPCVANVLWNQIPRYAHQNGYSVESPVHAHFVYDRGIPLWAGNFVGWLASTLGGTPIRRGSLDVIGLRSVRNLFADGQFPIAIAPEGATNGHNEIVSPIEPGIAQFGFWCVEDLRKANRSEPVMIVPLGIQYRYVEAPWKSLESLMTQLELEMGLPPLSDPNTGDGMSQLADLQDGVEPTLEQEKILYRRLYRMGEHLLSLMEEFYRKYYRQIIETDLPKTDASSDPSPPQTLHPSEANERLAKRLHVLLNAALNVAEQSFDVKPKGNLSDRCRRVEQAGWNRIYRDDLKNTESLSPVERGLADLVAEEADLRIWHMRLVETFVSVTGKYVVEKPTVERFADTTLLVWKTVTQITGKSRIQRPDLGAQYAQITVGEPLSVSDRWDAYQTNRRTAIAQLTHDLQTALEAMIE
ncbi:MAG: 1-acyl-sn-glycerol-3-phosphate acyltransferase [Elainellaceae cyanobacterium]